MSKRHAFWTHVILLTKRIWLTHHEETTETQSELSASPQQCHNIYKHMSQAVFIQNYVATSKNNMSENNFSL